MKNIFDLDTPFANIMNTLAGILLVGILWLLCSLPILTMGAASAAAYHTIVNVVRRGRNYTFSTFFEAFKDNLRVSLPMQIIGVFVFLLLACDVIYLYGYGTDFSQMLSYILYAFIILFFAISFYINPIMQRFDETRIEIFKLAFYMTFRYFLSTIGLVLLFAFCLFAVYMMPWSIVVVPGFWWYIQSFIIERLISRFSTVENDDYEEEVKAETKSDEKPGRTSGRRSRAESDVGDSEVKKITNKRLSKNGTLVDSNTEPDDFIDRVVKKD